MKSRLVTPPRANITREEVPSYASVSARVDVCPTYGAGLSPSFPLGAFPSLIDAFLLFLLLKKRRKKKCKTEEEE